jgi:hypothetical protein
MNSEQHRHLPLTLGYYTTGVPVYFANTTTGLPLQAPISILDNQALAQPESREVAALAADKKEDVGTQT